MALFNISSPTTLAPEARVPRPAFARLLAWAKEPVRPIPAMVLVVAVTLLGYGSMMFVPAESARGYSTAEWIIGYAMAAVILVGWLASWAGALRGKRWGLLSAVPVSGLLLFAAASCPLSGHHTAGLWTIGSIGTAGAAFGASLAGLKIGAPR